MTRSAQVSAEESAADLLRRHVGKRPRKGTVAAQWMDQIRVHGKNREYMEEFWSGILEPAESWWRDEDLARIGRLGLEELDAMAWHRLSEELRRPGEGPAYGWARARTALAQGVEVEA